MLNTGGVPALRFGVIKDGATKGMISKVRKLAGTMRGKTKRRSLFARLTLTKYDLGSDLILAPLVAWAKGLWDNLVPRTAMKEAWTHGLETVGRSTDCGKVYGAEGIRRGGLVDPTRLAHRWQVRDRQLSAVQSAARHIQPQSVRLQRAEGDIRQVQES